MGETVGENMRLIDADELIKQIQTTYCQDCEDCNKNRDFFHCHTEQIIGDIHFAPTIDPWHYPSKGELPEKDGEYFITVKIEGGGFLNALALYYVDRGWLGMFNKPYAWQYITSPKEEA